MLGANCETGPLRFPQNFTFFFLILHGGIHYLMFHFLISTWDDLQFLELLVSLLLSLVVMNIACVVNR